MGRWGKGSLKGPGPFPGLLETRTTSYGPIAYRFRTSLRGPRIQPPGPGGPQPGPISSLPLSSVLSVVLDEIGFVGECDVGTGEASPTTRSLLPTPSTLTLLPDRTKDQGRG